MSATGFAAMCLLVLQEIDGESRSPLAVRFVTPLLIFAAVLARPEASLLLIFPVVGVARRWKSSDRNSVLVGRFLPQVLAAASAVSLLLLYNWLRFDNPLDFGVSRLLGGVDHSKLTFSSVSYVVPNLYYYMLRPFSFTRDFPFIDFSRFDWPFAVSGTYLTSEVVAGLLFTVPAIVLLVRPRNQTNNPELRRVSIVLFFFVGFFLLFLSYAIFGATQRYRILVDLGLLIAILIRWGNAPPTKRDLTAGRSVAGFTVVLSLLAVVHGYYPDRVPENGFIKTLKGATSAIPGTDPNVVSLPGAVTSECASSVLAGVEKSGGTKIAPLANLELRRISVLLPSQGWEATAPLLIEGQIGSADVFGLQWDGRIARILHDHWHKAPRWTENIRLQSDVLHEFSFAFQRDEKRVSIFVDGVLVMVSNDFVSPGGPTAYGVNLVSAGTVSQSLQAPWFSTTPQISCGTKELPASSACSVFRSSSHRNSTPSVGFEISLVGQSMESPPLNFSPLMQLGSPGRGDTIGFRIDRGSVWLVHDHWGAAPSIVRFLTSNEFPLADLEFVVLGSSDLLQVFVDNHLVLSSDLGIYDPVSEPWFGVNSIGSTLVTTRSDALQIRSTPMLCVR